MHCHIALQDALSLLHLLDFSPMCLFIHILKASLIQGDGDFNFPFFNPDAQPISFHLDFFLSLEEDLRKRPFISEAGYGSKS